MTTLEHVHVKQLFKKRSRRRVGEKGQGATEGKTVNNWSATSNFHVFSMLCSLVFLNLAWARGQKTMHLNRALLLRKLLESLAISSTLRFTHCPPAEVILFYCEVWPSIHYVFVVLLILLFFRNSGCSQGLTTNNKTSYSKVIKFLRLVLCLNVLGL